ncbi:guanylin-like [Cyprinus carpio]|uniref:Guanylin-like n=1 Tax=Cyprinus carpio TaxID=7962 RepID=A0A9Q9YK55_CYPCA|nr:guanylin-like [Cyprinus carpio]
MIHIEKTRTSSFVIKEESHSSETVHLRLKIRALIIVLLLTTSFFQISQCVQVTDSGYSFSLEAVKTLKKLMETDTSTNPRQTYGDALSLRADPDLPGEFRVLCGKDDADEVFQHLGCEIISPIDPCEICANVACTGC